MKKCIWCLKDEENTNFRREAHIFPRALGGNRICDLVCDDCNSYFGNKSFGYTYGLKEFNKRELEILDSEKGLDDIRNFLNNMTHYILDYNVEFKDGQTCGLSETERIKITLSPGRFTESETLKLAY